LALAYQVEHQLDTVVFRLFNTVGPRQTGRYGMVLPRFVRQALRHEPLTVYGDGAQRRCFCDVRDAILAIEGLAHHPEAPGQVFNIGGTQEISIAELADRVRLAVGTASRIVRVPYAEAYGPGFEDMVRRVPNTARIQQLLGWQPTRSIDEIIADVIAFERSGLDEIRKTA
jgi:UDP-glucose 4-epimerase